VYQRYEDSSNLLYESSSFHGLMSWHVHKAIRVSAIYSHGFGGACTYAKRKYVEDLECEYSREVTDARQLATNASYLVIPPRPRLGQ
jgi:hypothetical protein